MGFNQTSTRVCVACVFALGAGAYWFFQIAPYTARAQNGRLTSEAIARRNERDYHFAGEITGRVLLDNGQPAVSVPVRARFVMHQTGAPGEGEARTDAQGNYRIHGLNPQGFMVQAENGGTPYIPEPERRIDLTGYPKRIASNVNFTLRLGPQITVRVREAETGAPVRDVEVNTTPFIGTGGQRIGETNAQGEFVFRASSAFVAVRLSADKLRKENIDAAPGYSFYKQFDFQNRAAANMVWEVKVYKNAYGAAPTHFRGVVKDAQGVPVWEARVSLRQDGSTQTAVTDPAGQFSLPARRIRSMENRSALLKVEKGNLSATVFPTAEQTWGVISVRLEASPKATVTGQVVNPQGIPVSNVPVEFLGVVRDTTDHSSIHSENGGVTDAAGKFTVSGLSEEVNYQFQFGGYSQFGHGANWGKSVFPDIGYSNGWLHLKNKETRNIGRVIVYPADAVVAGRVIEKKGVPMDELSVVITGSNYSFSAYPDVHGNFRFVNVVREPLKLHVYQTEDSAATRKPGDTSRSFRTSPGSIDDVYEADVRAGDTNVSVVVTKTRRSTP